MNLSHELDKQAMGKDQDMVYANYPEYFKKEFKMGYETDPDNHTRECQHDFGSQGIYCTICGVNWNDLNKKEKRICRNCGKELHDCWMYCNRCGKKIY